MADWPHIGYMFLCIHSILWQYWWSPLTTKAVVCPSYSGSGNQEARFILLCRYNIHVDDVSRLVTLKGMHPIWPCLPAYPGFAIRMLGICTRLHTLDVQLYLNPNGSFLLDWGSSLHQHCSWMHVITRTWLWLNASPILSMEETVHAFLFFGPCKDTMNLVTVLWSSPV